MLRVAFACLCVLLLATCSTFATPVQGYTVTALGGDYTSGEAINNAGRVIVSNHSLWENGSLTQLPIPAYGINDSGDIVGAGSLWRDGVVSSLGSLGDPIRVQAYAINEFGQAVGNAYVPAEGNYHAFLSQGGVMTDLNLGTAYSEAVDINRVGNIVGWMGASQYYGNGFLLSSGGVTNFGGNRPKAMNNAGQVVFDGKIWQNGTWTALSSMSMSEDINSYGWVVGTQIFSDPWGNQYDWQGKLWIDSTYYDLNSLIPGGSGWNLSFPRGINDRGQIVGEGYYNGVPRAFLLTPVPEPSSVLALGAGLFGLMPLMRRRRS